MGFQFDDLSIPLKVQKELEQLVKTYRIFSIILIGSYSRREHIKSSDAIQSDIEFYIITDEIIPHDAIQFSDISIIPPKKIKYLEKNLINYEVKNTGKTVYGKNFNNLFPEINIYNIEKAIIDEILIFRCREILKFWNSKDRNQIMEKNIFYLLTWVQIKNKILLPDFSKRYNHYLENDNKSIYKEFRSVSGILMKWSDIRKSNIKIDKWENLTDFYIRFYSIHKHTLFKEKSFMNQVRQIKYIICSPYSILKRMKILIELITQKDPRMRMIEEFLRVLRGECDANKVLWSINNYYPFLKDKE